MEAEEKGKKELVEKLKQEINKEIETLRDLEREKFTWKVKQQELSSTLGLVTIKEENLRNRNEAFLNEIKEGVALIGQIVSTYQDYEIKDIEENTQEEQRRKIERIKIKLEDAGLGSGTEIMKEFQEVSERDLFLAKELDDLSRSMKALEKLIEDLKEKIAVNLKMA